MNIAGPCGHARSRFFLTLWSKLEMKKSLIGSIAVVVALFATSALAQQKTMEGMEGMKGMPMHDMHNMQNMPAHQAGSGQSVHAARGKVTKIDGNTGVVTLAHGPVKSLNWPAMTMGFKVNDKMLLDQFGVGKTVDFEFIQAGKDYIITGAK
jgi:Cu(I)/Ag(I) efflux system protein CusF